MIGVKSRFCEPEKWCQGVENENLLQLPGYCQPPDGTISLAKKNDLVQLCKQGIINQSYHTFFNDLKVNTNNN